MFLMRNVTGKMDLVRRRLWLRKMVTDNPDAEPIFVFNNENGEPEVT